MTKYPYPSHKTLIPSSYKVMIQKSFQAKKRPKRNNLGKLGERIAIKFLQSKGYKLLTANYHIRGGELDLVCQKNGILVFVEVKTRHSLYFGEGEEALTNNKKQKLIRAIYTYLQNQHRLPLDQYRPLGQLWQLDLVAIHLRSSTATIKHFQNILLA